MPPARRTTRRGVIAVVIQHGRFLVIRRSRHVRAPGALCFPGGGIERGESEPEALCREMREELAASAVPLQPIWTNATPSGIALSWWATKLARPLRLLANPDEVDAFMWMTADQMQQSPHLLGTNRDFLASLADGQIRLPQPWHRALR